MAKCYILESKKRLSTADINKLSPKESKFIIFCLSKPIFKFNNLELKEYPNIFADITDDTLLPNWMETDILYTFKMKLLKKEVKNNMIPYHQIIDFRNLFKVDFIDSPLIAIRVSLGRLSFKEKEEMDKEELRKFEKKQFSKVFIFENMIEGYKFYSYCKALIKNQHEFYNTLKYKIHFNLGKID
jgi:hypothetical protein